MAHKLNNLFYHKYNLLDMTLFILLLLILLTRMSNVDGEDSKLMNENQNQYNMLKKTGADFVPRYKVYSGVKVPDYWPNEFIGQSFNYKPRADDIFMATYPKCGTHWMRHICYLLFNNGIEPVDVEEYENNTEFFGKRGQEHMDNMRRPGTMCLHLPFESTPFNEKAKYISVIRNPKDACISYYHHHMWSKNMSFDYDDDFEHFFNYWISGAVVGGDYFEFVKGWWNKKENSNVFIAVFEHLKANPKEKILDLAKFLGDEYLENLLDENLLEKICEKSSFDAMKQSFDLQGRHLREGKSGGWRKHFSKSQSDLVDHILAEKFSGTDLVNLWKEELKW
jgi:sulfotransferase